MKFGESGWLADYLSHREAHYSESKITVSRHPDFSLYNILQPSGILYGNPVKSDSIEEGSFDTLDEKLRLELILAESLINTALLFDQDKIHSKEDFSNHLRITVSQIGNFYNKVYPEISTSQKTLFGKNKTELEVAERILEKRVGLKQSGQQNFWVHFFSNTLIFLDIYFFAQWIHTSTDKVVTEFFKEEKEELRLSVIKVIIAAAHANDIIEVEERKLFEYILHAANLSSKRRKEASQLLEQGIHVEEIALPENNSWLLKKYFLELAILTVASDRVIDSKEHDFLANFTKHLGFFEEDLEDSMIALEGFIIGNWEMIGELQVRRSYEQLSQEYEQRLSKLLSKHSKKLSHEILKEESLVRLIEKYKSGEISPEDNARLKDELIDLLQKLPAFSSFTLPRKHLTLDILSRIIPDLPDSEE